MPTKAKNQKRGKPVSTRTRPSWAKGKAPASDAVPLRRAESKPAGAKVSPPKKPTGTGAKNRTEAINAWQKAQRKKEQDIGLIPVDGINWDRRLATMDSLRLFAETYLPAVFYYGWS